MIKVVVQRYDDDCGIAALATFMRGGYRAAREALYKDKKPARWRTKAPKLRAVLGHRAGPYAPAKSWDEVTGRRGLADVMYVGHNGYRDRHWVAYERVGGEIIIADPATRSVRPLASKRCIGALYGFFEVRAK